MIKPYSPQYKDFVKMLDTVDYVVLDTETTGIDSGEIVEICIASAKGEILLNERIKPARPIPADATRIHGISDADVENCKTYPEMVALIGSFLVGRNVVVYNAVYDRRMLHQSAERWDLPKTNWREVANWWCAMENFAELFGDWNDYKGGYRWQKLSQAARYFKVEQTVAHTALADVLTVVEICQKWPHYHE